ncbi:MAG: hypothetical protein ACTSYI_06330 [Promethearchaeota archaeon]
MPPPPALPRKKAPRKAQSQLRQRSRGQEIEAKKQLLKFVKSEYSLKKPLEIRLLRMKPSIVFKRGSMLPYLLIKSLQQTAYVVYLDYGEELRYYFFSIAGMSLGASTFEKTPQMLTELHGKAITLYKLPKHSALDAFDERSIKLGKEFRKQLQKYEKLWGLKIRNPPTLSIITNPLKYDSFRWGIHQEGKIYHVYQAVTTSEENKKNLNTNLNFVLGREIFCLAWRLDPNKEIHQALATFWVLSHGDEIQKKRFQPILQKITAQGRLLQKFKEWILKVWWPYSTSSNINELGDVGDTMLFFMQVIQRVGIFPWYAWGELLLLYFMTYNQRNLHNLAEIGTKPSHDHEIRRSYQPEQLLFEIFQFPFTQKQLLEKFKVDLTKGTEESVNLDEFFLWIAYFCAHSNAYCIIKDSTTFPTLIPYGDPDRFPELPYIMDEWSQKQYSASYEKANTLIRTIPAQETKFASVINKYIQETITFHISHGGIKTSVGVSRNDSVKQDQPLRYRLQIENLTDVILQEAEYTLECKPSKNLTTRFISKPHSALFDTMIKFELEILLSEPHVSGKVVLTGNFRHPFDNSRKLQLVLWEYSVGDK